MVINPASSAIDRSMSTKSFNQEIGTFINYSFKGKRKESRE
jgi:hypothetical protein